MCITQENKVALVFVLVMLLCCILFYQFAKPFGDSGHAAVFNMDTFLYMQYAKAWANGHPYCFNQLDSPTTGSTSHLYPFLLGIFYKMGFKGLSLIDVAFYLNVLFLLLSTFFYYKINCKMSPRQFLPIVLIFIFSGHLPLTILGLSDMGLFLLLTMLTWYTFLNQKYVSLSILLFLLPFARPEGIYIIILFILVFAISSFRSKEKVKVNSVKMYFLPIISGILGIVLLFVLHKLLTGILNYDSIGNKGYFNALPFLLACQKSLLDLLVFIKAALFGIGLGFRQFYFFSIGTGLLIFSGLLSQKFDDLLLNRSQFLKCWWLFSIFSTISMTTISGWQGVHYDRYFAWILPLLYPFLINSCYHISKNIRKSIILSIIIFQIIVYPYFLHAYTAACSRMYPQIKEINLIKNRIPPKENIALIGTSGVQYFLNDIKVINLGGVTSPYFRDVTSFAHAIKTVQNNPELSFKYFMSFEEKIKIPKCMIIDTLEFEIPYPQKHPIFIYSIDWTPMNEIQKIKYNDFQFFLKDKKIYDKIDIALCNDELKADYNIYNIFPSSIIKPFLYEVNVDSVTYCDAFRCILGYDSFFLNTQPGKKHWLVFRLLKKAEISIISLNGTNRVSVNTEKIDELKISINDNFWMDVPIPSWQNSENIKIITVPLPQDPIYLNKTQFALYGDHIISDYWIYIEI